MRYEWAIKISYINGDKKTYNFFCLQEAERFQEDMGKWKSTLEIDVISDPIELHPQGFRSSLWIISKFEQYLKNINED